jgi:titin
MVDGAYSLIETKKPDTNSEDFTDIIGDQNYKFRVLAEDSVTGRSAWSIEHQYNSPIGKPSQPHEFNKVSATKSSIKVGWERPMYNGGSDVTGYVVQYRL